jgi:type I restriction-modification system DNA methylase subunit
MLTGELRSRIDAIWNTFWTGGISNPLEVIEQITYLLFLRRLDEIQTVEEAKAARFKKPIERSVFPSGKDSKGVKYEQYRWSRFKNLEAREMYELISESVFPWLRKLGGNASTYSHHMKDARFTIPTPGLLAKVVDLIDHVPMEDRDTKGDLYEYMLAKIATAGQNGQFRTPRHIIQLMAEMVEPAPKDIVCDPACGTCGFLIAVGEFIRQHHKEALTDPKLRKHFHENLFHGFDFDNTMLRIGSMNMLLHGIENPAVTYRDSLSQDHAGEEEKYTLVLANPPFAGSLDYENTAKDLLQVVKTKKTELLFVTLFLRLLKAGGRAAVIVPAGVLESDSEAHSTVRKLLVEDNRLEAVIALPHWIFKPYASVATSILIFSKSGTTDRTWFYRLENDGFNDDAAKSPRKGSEIPSLLSLWKQRRSSSYLPLPAKHRFVTREEIEANDYDLCERVYLSGYVYPSGVPLKTLDELFMVTKGNVPAASADGGQYQFVTSSEEVRFHSSYSFDGEGICIPLVSATGHGHASIKTIHYVQGRFEASTITAVLSPRPHSRFNVQYVFYYLLAHKDELLVPLMRGAANISLNIDRLRRLRVPLPTKLNDQRAMVSNLSATTREIQQLKSALRARKQEATELLAGFRRTF